MPRLVVRRRAPGDGALLLPALLALGVGALAGFVLGELYGPATERRLTSPRRSDGAPTLAELVHDAQEALAADPELAELDLEIRPVRRGTVELRGWVPTRAHRARAQRVAREAIAAAGEVINRVLVHGEDDGTPALDILSA